MGTEHPDLTVSGHAGGYRHPVSEDPDDLLIAVGDLHGTANGLDTILAALQSRFDIFDDNHLQRLRGHVTLVFTGDYIDRGEGSIRVLERLGGIREASGNRIVLLMGNHELMALHDLDRLRDIVRIGGSNPIYDYEMRTMHGRNGGDQFVYEFVDELEDDLTPAVERYLAQMERTALVGDQLRALKLLYIHKIAGKRFLFTHGDIPPEFRSAEVLAQTESQFSDWMEYPTIRGTEAKYGSRIPGYPLLWGRDYRREFDGLSSLDAAQHASEICRRCGVDYLINGHSINRDKVVSYGQRIIDIDVGRHLGEEPQALVVQSRGISVLRASGELTTLTPFNDG